MRREWDAGQRMQPLWCWGVTEGTGDQAGHLVGRLTLLWALLHRGTCQPVCCCRRLDQPPGSFFLLHSCISTQASPTIVPPFLSLAVKLKVLAKYLYFSPRRVKKKPHQGTKLCFKFSLSRTTGFIFALISKLENKPDAAARAAAAPGTACEAQALLTPLTVPRPAFPHPTSAGFKKQPHTDARYTPGRTLPPPVHAPAPEARIPAARRTTEGGQPPA